ncbi:metal-dependent phosphohydrolase, partial [Streptomyces sp. T21Q-yed]|nr:metal-dependent phosphohydrolase [Streptomyces sp. T21Q-yed]
MSAPRTTGKPPLLLTLVHTSAALVAAGSLLGSLGHGLDERGTALAFGVLVTVGELTRWTGAEGREAAPLGAAAALSYALLGEDGGHPTHHGVLQVGAVVLAASLLGSVPHIARGRPVLDHLA